MSACPAYADVCGGESNKVKTSAPEFAIRSAASDGKPSSTVAVIKTALDQMRMMPERQLQRALDILVENLVKHKDCAAITVCICRLRLWLHRERGDNMSNRATPM